MEERWGFTKTKKENLSDKIHDRILEMIIQNPSEEEQVLTENKLVEMFGVSKAPVREALIKMCSEGIVKSVPRYGYVVIHMTEKEAQEVISMRILLETQALRETMPGFNDSMLDDLLAQISKTTSKQNRSIWDVWDENEEFHLMLASFSGNKVLMRFLKECMGMEKRIYAQRMWKANNRMDAPADGVAHMAICSKLAGRDLEGAILLLEDDVRGVQ